MTSYTSFKCKLLREPRVFCELRFAVFLNIWQYVVKIASISAVKFSAIKSQNLHDKHVKNLLLLRTNVKCQNNRVSCNNLENSLNQLVT